MNEIKWERLQIHVSHRSDYITREISKDEESDRRIIHNSHSSVE